MVDWGVDAARHFNQRKTALSMSKASVRWQKGVDAEDGVEQSRPQQTRAEERPSLSDESETRC